MENYIEIEMSDILEEVKEHIATSRKLRKESKRLAERQRKLLAELQKRVTKLETTYKSPRD